MLYEIHVTATVTRVDDRGVAWTLERQLPTFLLDADIQGIRDEVDAERVARRILGDYDPPFKVDTVVFHIVAFRRE